MSAVRIATHVFIGLAICSAVYADPKISLQPSINCNIDFNIYSCTVCRLDNFHDEMEYTATIAPFVNPLAEYSFDIDVKSKLVSMSEMIKFILDGVFSIDDLEPLTEYHIIVKAHRNMRDPVTSNLDHFESAGPSSVCTVEHTPCLCAKQLVEKQNKTKIWIFVIVIILLLLCTVGIWKLLTWRRR
jgi:hypothetical protein